MPSIACRDVDEVCDWFFLEDDAAALLVHSIAHGEETHAEVFEKWHRTRNPSEIIETQIGAFRH